MQFTTDYRAERWALGARWETFPAAVRTQAIMCGVDLFGALILGSRGRQFMAGQSLVKTLGLSGAVPVIGGTPSSLLGAAIAMGHSSNSFDIDDGFNLIKGHPGASFAPGVLAAALDRNVPFREYLAALTVCYELTVRWALAMQDHYRFLHSSGAYGAFGTALGVGRLLGLDEKKLNNALSIADYHAPMTPVMRAVEYPSMNKDGIPFGALVGTMAVLETLSGTTGRTHLLELPEYSGYLDNLGEKYFIQELYFKPYTCCRWAHQPILACQTLMGKYGFSHREVSRVKVNTFSAAARLSKKKPRDTDEAQYNIAFPIASALVHGDVGFQQIRDEALDDPDVLSMMERLEFSVDPVLEAQFPERRLAWVEILLKDGRVLRSEVLDAPGEHTDPELDLEWVLRKFRKVTAPILTAGQQEDLLRRMTGQPETPVRVIVEQINRALACR